MKETKTITVKIYLGLREGYSDIEHNIDEVKELLQEYVDRVGLCVTITPTDYIYRDGKERGAIIGLINYPRFPTVKSKLEHQAEEIALLCKNKFKQNRVSIEYQNRTIMLE